MKKLGTPKKGTRRWFDNNQTLFKQENTDDNEEE